MSRLQFSPPSSSPKYFIPTAALDLSLGNTRLLAGVIAILVAWYTKNTLLTILAGMLALLILQFL